MVEDDIGYTIDKLEVGMSRSYAKTVTEADILMFAAASGDMNAVHLNQEFAEHTAFRGRIAHGLLTAGIVSACIGNKLPGLGTIYLSQTLRFKAPVHPGDTVRAINEAYERMLKSDVKYRFVVDMASLN